MRPPSTTPPRRRPTPPGNASTSICTTVSGTPATSCAPPGPATTPRYARHATGSTHTPGNSRRRPARPTRTPGRGAPTSWWTSAAPSTSTTATSSPGNSSRPSCAPRPRTPPGTRRPSRASATSTASRAASTRPQPPTPRPSPTFVTLGDRRGQADTYVSLGYLHQSQRRYDEATAAYDKALAVYETVRSLIGQATAHVGLAGIHQAQNRLDLAPTGFRTAQALYTEANLPSGATLCQQALDLLGETENPATTQ
ncbi:tetratricopeptide repeat protein [Streptomyces broussonetiae]|uniref:tetratricopeptide repeat protein n=1 Tax=Streptomyces broussonetiae TaxID=2686304 RepID=UPI0035D824E5